MPLYYPNFQNDMWRIFGIIYFGDKLHFVDVENKTYRLDAIKEFLKEKGVAIYDTAQQVIRTKNTASDKDLQIVQPSGLRKSRKWAVLWSLSLKTAGFASIACLRVRGPIRWRWRRRQSTIERCLRKSYS